MDLFASQTSDIIERIRKGALVSTHEELEAAMMLAEKQRPSDYWAVVKGVSRRYSGEQKSILAEALKKAYPDTSEPRKMLGSTPRTPCASCCSPMVMPTQRIPPKR